MSTRVNVHLVPCDELQRLLSFLNDRIVREAGLVGVNFASHRPHLTVLMFDLDRALHHAHKERLHEHAAQVSHCCPVQLTGLRVHVNRSCVMLQVDYTESLREVCEATWRFCGRMLSEKDAWRVEPDWYDPHITVAIAEWVDVEAQVADVQLASRLAQAFCEQCPSEILVCDRVDVGTVGAHGTVLGSLVSSSEGRQVTNDMDDFINEIEDF